MSSNASGLSPSSSEAVRVLLVDDNDDHVRLIAQLLRASRDPRILLETSGDPESAVRRIDEGVFDAILLDYCLPGRNGLEVLREVNRERRRPVIILTGQGDEKTVVEFFHAGAYDYLLKTMDRGFGETLRRTIREVIRRVALEQQVERARLRSEAVLESLTQMVCCLDLDLQVRESNSSFRRFVQSFTGGLRPGATAPDPVGLSVPDLIGDPGTRAQRVAMLRAIIEQGETFQEEIEIAVGGSPRLLFVQAVPLRVGEVTEGVVVSMTDLTEQRRALHHQLRLARAVDASLDGIVITDRRGRIEYVNPAFVQTSGYSSSQLLGRRSRFLQPMPGKPHTARVIWENLSRGEEWQGEVVNRKKDGGIYIADMTISPIRDDAGQVLGFVSTERDVTERKLFTDELIKARETAEETLRAKDMFLATVSHELRTPLTSIIGFADLLLMEPATSGNTRSFAESILRGGRTLKQLIGNILDFSRFAAGRFYLDLEALPLRTTLEEVLEIVDSEVAETPCTFTLDLDPSLPEDVVIDRMKVQQVLLNLLSNAAKYAGGKIELRVSLLFQSGTEGDRPGRSGRFLLFSVSDRGPGIPAEQSERIFEAFVQLETGIARRRGGTGLGLAISRRLVELMGGTIWVEASPEKGSTFLFTLPLTARAAGPAGGATAGSAAQGDRGLPLLIHRAPAASTPGEDELASWGYRIQVTSTESELQRALETAEPFACVVSAAGGLSDSLRAVAESASLAGDRVAWFLMASPPGADVVSMGRIIPVGESLGPRSVVRLMRALDPFPPGRKRLLVDPQDTTGAYWARDAFEDRGLRVIAAGGDEISSLMDAEEIVVLLLDLARDPARALALWRDVADRATRLILALRYPRGERKGWCEALDSAWREHALEFRPQAEARLRWMLNAIHTCGSHGRIALSTGFADPARSDADQKGTIGRPDRPILVVEDHAENLDLVCRMLASFNLPWHGVKNAADALEHVKKESPSLVLMDIQMPGMDGYHATRAIHRMAGREHLPVVAMTAHVGTEDRRRCHEAGCVDFLAKPIERSDLMRLLQRWLPSAAATPSREQQGGRQAA